MPAEGRSKSGRPRVSSMCPGPLGVRRLSAQFLSLLKSLCQLGGNSGSPVDGMDHQFQNIGHCLGRLGSTLLMRTGDDDGGRSKSGLP